MKRMLSGTCALLLATTALWATNSRLPDGTEFPMWEKPQHFSKTYYVDIQAKNADDNGPGSKERPFRSINKAAQVLQPRERVVIASGVYRECVRPARGGTGPEAMISYEAAPGAKVVIKGSREVTGWQPSEGWNFNPRGGALTQQANVWQLHLDPSWFNGYNPFAMVNVLENRYWLDYAKDNMATYFRRRGLVFVDGHPLEPVDVPNELVQSSTRSLNFFGEAHWTPLFQEFQPVMGKFWIENNGMTLHIRLANDDNPNNHTIEITTQEQVFVPAQRYQQYIRLKGLNFAHAGNGFPVPQRGMVSANRGNHWIVENNTFEWANSVGLDIGNEDWSASAPKEPVGFDVIRGNTFRYCGIEGIGGTGTPGGSWNDLIEKNLFEWIGWQDAAMMSESGATKLHQAKNLLFRSNVVRHIRHANGIWLDIANANVRITGNVFADIPGNVNPHAIHIEGSNDLNEIDNNVFAHVKGGILIRDTNNVIVAYNFFLDCEDVGLGTTSGLGKPRPILGHTNDVHGLRVFGNVFQDMGRTAVEFMNTRNETDGNVFGKMPFDGAYLRILTPEPQQWHNIDSWREQYGWEKNGATAQIDAKFDIDKLELTFSSDAALKPQTALGGVDTDFAGKPVTGPRVAGPFPDLTAEKQTRNIDPRQ